MCQELCIDNKSPFKNYLISEATFGVKNNIIPWREIEKIQKECIEDLLKLPFIDSNKKYNFSYNIEPYVYPIQDQNFKLEYKKAIYCFCCLSVLFSFYNLLHLAYAIQRNYLLENGHMYIY